LLDPTGNKATSFSINASPFPSSLALLVAGFLQRVKESSELEEPRSFLLF
jgi:hypothetical protein